MDVLCVVCLVDLQMKPSSKQRPEVELSLSVFYSKLGFFFFSFFCGFDFVGNFLVDFGKLRNICRGVGLNCVVSIGRAYSSSGPGWSCANGSTSAVRTQITVPTPTTKMTTIPTSKVRISDSRSWALHFS